MLRSLDQRWKRQPGHHAQPDARQWRRWHRFCQRGLELGWLEQRRLEFGRLELRGLEFRGLELALDGIRSAGIPSPGMTRKG